MAEDARCPSLKTGRVELKDVLSTKGIDFLRGMSEGKFPLPPMASVIPIHLSAVERGTILFEALPEERFYNPIGTVHGGYSATLLDTAMACAVHSTLDAGEAYTTLEFKVNFVRPLRAYTGRIEIGGKVLHRSTRSATAEGEIRDARGKLYAHATTTCMIFDTRETKSGR